jgi:nickel-type superoxide dismutase maturation protease
MCRLLRSWRRRVAVQGHSMEPTLYAGDWLLVDPVAYRTRAPTAGELVVAVDPRKPDRWLVKRVADVTADGRLALAGEHPAHADDRSLIDPVGHDALIGRPWLRYWPIRRFGRLD